MNTWSPEYSTVCEGSGTFRWIFSGENGSRGHTVRFSVPPTSLHLLLMQGNQLPPTSSAMPSLPWRSVPRHTVSPDNAPLLLLLLVSYSHHIHEENEPIQVILKFYRNETFKNPCTVCHLQFAALVTACGTLSRASCRTFSVGPPLCQKHLDSVRHRAASACRSSVHSCFPPPSRLTTPPPKHLPRCSCPCKAPLRGITASSSPLKHNPRRRIWDSFTHTALTHYPPLIVCGGQVSTGSLGTDSLIHICALRLLSCFDTGLLSVSLTTANTF